MPRKRYRRKKKEGDWLGGVVVVLTMIIFTNMDRGGSVQGLASSLLTSFIVSAVLVVIGLLVFKALKANKFSVRRGIQYTERPKQHRSSSNSCAFPKPSVEPDHRLVDSVAAVNVSKSLEETEHDSWSLTLIGALEWRRFEKLCMEYFKLKGYEVKDTGSGADGGTDFYLYRPDVSDKPVAVVQCKSWSNKPVGVKTVRELFGVMAAEKIPNAIVMVSGTFTVEAKGFTDSKRLKLIDGQQLLAMIHKLSEPAQKGLLHRMTQGDFKTPSCPSCDVKLVARAGKAGRSDFWGCGNFPKCRYTMKRAA